jgi:cytochrome c oxidase cbb3-type subunit I/II
MILMAYNLFRTIRSGHPATATIEVQVPEVAPKEGMSLVGGFLNPPVIYSFLLVLFSCGWGFFTGLASTVALVLLVETAIVAMIHLSVSGKKWNDWYEKLLESWLPFTVLTFVAVVAGGMIQILPAVFVKQSAGEDAPMQIVYTPLELAGRDIYIREGCYNCHSQMIRSLVGDVLRYGKSGRLTESVYDFPFQWGSKRTGPDIERVGGKYPNIWHFQHMMDPRSTSIGSVMPAYPWLFKQLTDIPALTPKIRVLTSFGVPFPPRSPDDIRTACLDQGRLITDDLAKNGIKIAPDKEIIAVIAYLQQLGKSTVPPPISAPPPSPGADAKQASLP